MFFDHLPGAGYVCAHRGARALAPENTMLAAEKCLKLGADFWELDIHKVADGALVVFHDDVLTRTTDIATRPEFADRAPWPTHAFSLDELRRLDAGSWFIEADPHGTIAAGDVSGEDMDHMHGQRIPTLREALEFTRSNRFPVNIEIKDQQQAPGDMSIVADLLRMIRKTQTEDLVLVSSFNHDYLREMHRLAPHLPLAALVEDGHPQDIAAHLRTIGATGYHPCKEITDPELVRALADQGIRVAPFTVNDMDRALSLLRAGCFAIITDFPHTLRQRLADTSGR